MFEALRKISNPNLRFVVLGDGPLRDRFEMEAKGLNVTFTGRLPYSQMCGALTACDMVVNPIVGSSVASIINKHADYAASGKPVLNTQRSEEYKGLIEDYGMGFNCKDSDDLAARICFLIEKKESLLQQIGNNARRCAEERFDRNHTYKSMIKLIKGEEL